MTSLGGDPGGDTRVRGPRAVVARALSGRPRAPEMRFAKAFTIGSDLDADFQLLDAGVSKIHAEVIADGILWWIRDLSGAAGTFVDGARVTMVPLRETTELELGRGGPRVRLELVKVDRDRPTQTREAPALAPGPPSAPASPAAEGASYGGFTSETQILRRFLRKQGSAPAGRETLMFQKAFERVRKRSSLPYQIAAGAALVALVVAAIFIVQQQRKLKALRQTAERLFYATRAVEVEIAQLEDVVLTHADRKDLSDLLARKARVSHMEAEYDTFVKELGLYAKLPEDEQIIFRTARAFGECEVNVPPEFVAEVKRYVQRWKTSDRLNTALRRSGERGYGPAIQRTLVEAGLPRQFVYLPLVESAYDERAIGPPTRFGRAKGMWQFIAPTAGHFGLKVGPLYEEASYDAKDERFEWQKATTAATRYIRELLSSDAQGSGLLVMACYNWGENNVRALIESLPATPQDRNFWRLLRDKKVPRETYDYVLSIFSAAVICEDPHRFGFDLTCPVIQPLAAESR